MPRLVQLLHGGGSDEMAALALCSIVSSHPAGAAAVEAAGGQAALQQCARSDDARVRDAVAGALLRLDGLAPPQPVPAAPTAAPCVCAADGCGATAHLRRCGGCGRVRY